MISANRNQTSDYAAKRSRPATNPKLDRETFEMSHELEYFSEKELRAQIGYTIDFWPVAVLRELIDNALDAAEITGVHPVIEITTSGDCITVTDNGVGIPDRTVERSLDYSSRVSNKAYYVSPTRGQMGNALKVIYAAPFVATGSSLVEISARGIRHNIELTLDRIAQRVRIKHETEPSIVKTGTVIKLAWRDSTTSIRRLEENSYNSAPTADELVAEFAALNPHATFILNGKSHHRTMAKWGKWTQDQPISPHWYNEDTLRDLIAAYIARKEVECRTVRKFVSEFRGLTGTAKQKQVTEGWSGMRLHDFVTNDDVDPEFVKTLLHRMRAASKAPSPRLLGAIGKDHLSAWMESQGVSTKSIRYVKKQGIDGMPFVMEIAFGVNEENGSGRHILTGLNWSPAIGGDPELTLRRAVAQARLDIDDPVTLVVHIATPRFKFADRGKTTIELRGDLQAAIEPAMRSVTKSWKKAKRQADQDDRLSRNQIARLRSAPHRVTTREAAFDVMEEAYNKASSNGKYLANARQIMYAARPAILSRIGVDQFSDVYFTQTLLKDYLDEFKPDWRVVWDARGNFLEPHTGHKIPLGGAAVGQYRREWDQSDIELETPKVGQRIETRGPRNRYSSVLFIEKEGFAEILESAGIGCRYDTAIMSTKGLPVKAASDLLRNLFSHNVRIFVVRDFDLAGFKIVRTIRTGTRLSSGSPVIDLGLRLKDIQDLESELVIYRQQKDPGDYLRQCGASPEEIGMLVNSRIGGWHGQRVEINAMTSEQLIEWLDAKFAEHGVKKLIPDADTLEKTYLRAIFRLELQAEIDHFERQWQDDDLRQSANLTARVKTILQEDPRLSWDDAIGKIAETGDV